MKTGWLVLLAVTGCAVAPADVGTPCHLVKSNPDGGQALLIKESDPEIAFAANQDIISFGAEECSTRVCVRDSTFQENDADDFANGYCSTACGPCSRDTECRALLLDEATLMRLKASDPERYKKTFGEAPTPYFCARGGADAGR